MAQMGFFDLSDRYASLDAKCDPLVEIEAVVPWEEFRPGARRRLAQAGCGAQVARRAQADGRCGSAHSLGPVAFGASPFKTLVLGALYNLSDDQIEHQIRDRLSFMSHPAGHCGAMSREGGFRGSASGIACRTVRRERATGPSAAPNTVWLYREALAKAGKMDDLFALFDGYLARQGYIARGGRILDGEPLERRRQRYSDRWRTRWQLRETMANDRAGPEEPQRAGREQGHQEW